MADAIQIGGAAALAKFFVDSLDTPQREADIPFDAEQDYARLDFPLPLGTVDIVILHGDGSATLIEARDGSKGHSHVAGGIGHVTLMAAQLGLSGRGQTIRRALLWSSTGDRVADLMLDTACGLAGVISLPWPTMQRLLSETSAALEAAVVIAAAAESQ